MASDDKRGAAQDDGPFLPTLIANRPLAEKPSARASCPYCGGGTLRRGWASHTALGGGDGTRDGDPNHWWEAYNCSACGQSFTRETKSGNVWYTAGHRADGVVLAGLPSCFEHYEYRCARCPNGSVTVRHTELDGQTPTVSLSITLGPGGGRHYRTFYACETCGAEEESQEDHWYGR